MQPTSPHFLKKLVRYIGTAFFYLSNLGVFLYVYKLILFDFTGRELSLLERLYSLEKFFFTLGPFSQIALALIIVLPLISLFIPFTNKVFSTVKGIHFYFFAIEIPLYFYALLVLLLAMTGDDPRASFLKMPFTLVIFTPVLTALLSLLNVSWKEKISALLLYVHTLIVGLVTYYALLYSFYLPAFLLGITDQLLEQVQNVSYLLKHNSFFELLLRFLPFPIGYLLTAVLPILLLYWIYKKLGYYTKQVAQKHGSQRARLVLLLAGLTLAFMWFIATQKPEEKYALLLGKYVTALGFQEKQKLAQEIQAHSNQIISEAKSFSFVYTKYPLRPTYSIIREFYYNISFLQDYKFFIDTAFLVIAQPYVSDSKSSIPQDKIAQVLEEVLNYDLYTDKEIGENHSSSFSNQQLRLETRTAEARTQLSGRLALITVTEEFFNTSSIDQETTSSFTLPIGSAVVDLKLGNNLEFSGVIAPRKAAEKTYEAQIDRRIDPALLQQVGPDQYLLRVYPIPRGQRQKVQYSYITTLRPEGFGLPQFVKEENYQPISTVFTTLKLDSQSVTIKNENFLPAPSSFCSLQNVPADSKQNQSFLISTIASTQHFCSAERDSISFVTPEHRHVGFILDVAATSKKSGQAEKLITFLEKNSALLETNEVYLYQVNTEQSAPILLTKKNFHEVISSITWFGKSNFLFELQQAPKDLDAVFYLTAQSVTSVPIEDDLKRIKQLPPLYLVTADPQKSPSWFGGLADAFFGKEVVLTSSLEEAWLHFAAKQELHNAQPAEMVDPYWQVELADSGQTLLTDLVTQPSNLDQLRDDFPQLFLAFNRLKHTMARSVSGISLDHPDANTLSILDSYTRQSEQLRVVTQLTSLVALINQQQLDQLAANSKQNDRYGEIEFRNAQSRILPRAFIGPEVGLSASPFSFSSETSFRTKNISPALGTISSSSEQTAMNTSATTRKYIFSGIIIVLFFSSIIAAVIYGVTHRFKESRVVKKPS